MPTSSPIGSIWCCPAVCLSLFAGPKMRSFFLRTNGSIFSLGRTLNACQNAFRQFATSTLPSAQPPFPPPVAEASSRKRPYPSETFTPTGRMLKPKPATYPAESSRPSMSTQGSFPHSPLGEPPPSLGEPRKKRGRPTKKEQEERRKQTELQKQSSTSQDLPQATQMPPAQVAAGPSNFPTIQSAAAPTATTPKGPSQEESTNSGSSSEKRRRGRPPRGSSMIVSAPLFSPITTTSTTAPAPPTYETPPQVSSTHDRPGSTSAQSESATQTQASVAPESTTTVAPAAEQQEDTKRSTRPRIWEQ